MTENKITTVEQKISTLKSIIKSEIGDWYLYEEVTDWKNRYTSGRDREFKELTDEQINQIADDIVKAYVIKMDSNKNLSENTKSKIIEERCKSVLGYFFPNYQKDMTVLQHKNAINALKTIAADLDDKDVI